MPGKIIIITAALYLCSCTGPIFQGGSGSIGNGFLPGTISTKAHLIKMGVKTIDESIAERPVVVGMIKDQIKYKYRFMYLDDPFENCKEQLRVAATIHYDNKVEFEYVSYYGLTDCIHMEEKKSSYFSGREENSCTPVIEEDKSSGMLILKLKDCRFDKIVPDLEEYLNVEELLFIVNTGQDILMYDNFNSYKGRVLPYNWAETDESFGTFQGYYDTYQSCFGTGQRSYYPISANAHTYYVGERASAWSDYEFSGRMRTYSPIHQRGSIGVTFYEDHGENLFYSLKNDATLEYGEEKDFYLEASPGVNASFVCKNNNHTGVDRIIGWYNFKIRIKNFADKTQIQASVWQEGTGEPPKWQIECYDESPDHQTSGTIGIWTDGEDGAEHSMRWWDDLRVSKTK